MKAAGGSLNDAYVAILTGALRRYLARNGAPTAGFGRDLDDAIAEVVALG